MQIAIVLYPGFTALDIVGPYEVLRVIPDAEIRFVWSETGPVMSDSGVLMMGATHSFEETPRPDMILVGGSGSTTAITARNEELLAWLRGAHEAAAWTVSVCTGSIILGSAGLLEGRPATTHWMAMPLLEGLGALPVADERVVRSGKIVTGAGVSAGIDVALWVVGQVSGDETARAAQLMIEYDPQPPYDSGSVQKADAATKRAVGTYMAREASTAIASEPGMLARELGGSAQLAWRTALAKARRRRFGVFGRGRRTV